MIEQRYLPHLLFTCNLRLEPLSYDIKCIKTVQPCLPLPSREPGCPDSTAEIQEMGCFELIVASPSVRTTSVACVNQDQSIRRLVPASRQCSLDPHQTPTRPHPHRELSWAPVLPVVPSNKGHLPGLIWWPSGSGTGRVAFWLTPLLR